MLLQRQTTSIRPLATAHLAQTMTLMSLTAMDLREKIESTLASNPALEIVDGYRCPICQRPVVRRGACPICKNSDHGTQEEPIVFVSAREDFTRSGKSYSSGDEMPTEEIQAEVEDLPHYVLKQIAPELNPEDRPIAAHILTGLDEDGLFRTPILEISRYHHVPPSNVEKIINLIQRADPIGVGSQNPQDALLVQLEMLSESRPVPDHCREAIQDGLDYLSRHQYSELGRALGIPTAKAQEIAIFISENLNPFPARAHWGNSLQPQDSGINVFTLPDILIYTLDGSPDSTLVVEVISPLVGRLRINPLFRKALSQAPDGKLEQWQNDIEQATLLIKCIQQRNHTIVRLAQKLVSMQREFIMHGAAHLKPVTRASMAKMLDVHESTISRAVSSKAVQLPNGKIIPMARFFDRSLHIRTALCQIIAEERKPLTDTQLVRKLKQEGYSIARRTVAKYRAMEGILPAHLRGSIKPTRDEQALPA